MSIFTTGAVAVRWERTVRGEQVAAFLRVADYGSGPYFSLTGEGTAGPWRGQWGTIHEAVAQDHPGLAPLIPWHLSAGGVPLNYEANALYWAELVLGIGNRWNQEPPPPGTATREILARHLLEREVQDSNRVDYELMRLAAGADNGVAGTARKDFCDYLFSRRARLRGLWKDACAAFDIPWDWWRAWWEPTAEEIAAARAHAPGGP